MTFNNGLKLITVIASCVRPSTQTVVVLGDKDNKDEILDFTELYCNKLNKSMSRIKNKIKFANGSVIEFLTKQAESDTIRGRRSELLFFYDDEPCIDDKIIDEAVKPYIK